MKLSDFGGWICQESTEEVEGVRKTSEFHSIDSFPYVDILKFESGLSLSVTLTIFKWDESVTQLCKVDLFPVLSSTIIIHRKSSSLQFIQTM